MRKRLKNGTFTFSHNMSKTPAYKSWASMIQRCENPKNPAYKLYGERGIIVCEGWHTFENFYRDMGNPPVGTSIDRINNNGNYEPYNCRWSNKKDQANNRSTNTIICFNDKKLTISQWSKLTGIKVTTIIQRFKYGWSVEKALTTQTKKYIT